MLDNQFDIHQAKQHLDMSDLDLDDSHDSIDVDQYIKNIKIKLDADPNENAHQQDRPNENYSKTEN